MDTWQPTFDGLTLVSHGMTPMEEAARASLADLDKAKLLHGRHALTCQLILELARVIGAGVVSGKTAAVALAAKQLLEAIDSLPKVDESVDDGFDELMRKLADAS